MSRNQLSLLPNETIEILDKTKASELSFLFQTNKELALLDTDKFWINYLEKYFESWIL
jgi:hypothetical protein